MSGGKFSYVPALVRVFGECSIRRDHREHSQRDPIGQAAWTTRLFSFCAGPCGASSADSSESRCEPSRCRLALLSNRARFAAAACCDDMGVGFGLTGRCEDR